MALRYITRPSVLGSTGRRRAFFAPRLVTQTARWSTNQPESIGAASLQSLDFLRLQRRHPAEVNKLVDACENDGFFYLDLDSPSTGRMLQDWKTIFSVMAHWFQRPLPEKMRYHRGTVLHGYTPVGTYAGVYENTRDGNETIKITDEAVQASPPILPDLFFDHRPLFERFISDTRGIASELLSCLSDALGLRGDSRFENSHRADVPANCSLNLFCYPRSSESAAAAAATADLFGQNKHTDNGSLTVLFADQPGLEMLSPRTEIWGRVLPKPGHAVINVGDTLRFLSGRRFRSAIHRVIPTFRPDQQQRLAVGYFLRAEDSAVFRDNDGRAVTAREWHDRKYLNYKASHVVQRTNSILTGGMEETLIKDPSAPVPPDEATHGEEQKLI